LAASFISGLGNVTGRARLRGAVNHGRRKGHRRPARRRMGDASPDASSNGADLGIGCDSNTSISRSWNGWIDEVR
jgi:hypothetical protein